MGRIVIWQLDVPDRDQICKMWIGNPILVGPLQSHWHHINTHKVPTIDGCTQQWVDEICATSDVQAPCHLHIWSNQLSHILSPAEANGYDASDILSLQVGLEWASKATRSRRLQSGKSRVCWQVASPVCSRQCMQSQTCLDGPGPMPAG